MRRIHLLSESPAAGGARDRSGKGLMLSPLLAHPSRAHSLRYVNPPSLPAGGEM